jgi:hypothetical protein
LQRDNYSVRWTGTFTPPAPGDYKLGVRVNYCYACENEEGFRLYLDEKVLVESGAKGTCERGAVIEAPVHFVDAKPTLFASSTSTVTVVQASTSPGTRPQPSSRRGCPGDTAGRRHHYLCRTFAFA